MGLQLLLLKTQLGTFPFADVWASSVTFSAACVSLYIVGGSASSTTECGIATEAC